MRKLVLILLLTFISNPLYAGERVKRYVMQDSTGKTPLEPEWVTVDSAGSRSVWFYFDHSVDHTQIQNTGFSTITIRIDTVDSDPIAANLDTVDALLTFMNYDRVDNQYEEPSLPLSGDTLQIRNNWRWSVNHSDDKYQISKTLNFRTGFDAAKLTLSTNTATDPFRFNSQIEITEDR